MAKRTSKTSKKSKPARKKISLTLSRPQIIILGSGLILFGVALFFSFLSYFFNWKADQSLGGAIGRDIQARNWLEDFGNKLGEIFVYDGFGIAAFIIAGLIFLTGIHYFFGYKRQRLLRSWFWGILLALWISIFFGFFGNSQSLLSGIIGYEINDLMQDYIGLLGTVLVMIFFAVIYLVVRVKVTPEQMTAFFKRTRKEISEDLQSDAPQKTQEDDQSNPAIEELGSAPIDLTQPQPASIPEPRPASNPEPQPASIPEPISEAVFKTSLKEEQVAMEVEAAETEEEVSENLSKQLVTDFGEFDPTLELSKYKFPTIDLLKDYSKGQGITINQEELEANKNRIVETLSNYKIAIANIKATVGPTVTLYEIVPEAGIRISKIKNLEDDIALSLSALGIRIIAPIPGRGTIGIEVPNKNPQIVSMRAAIASPKFQNAEMELPLSLGKTISNETFVVDLAKMPHLLMAGATGQGKSVGLNAILTSLLYKKHPAEVKFVLVDPKKVELTLFNKIERHFLAKLPDTEEAIITDTNKVINTLNSLCIEMDARYDLLKDAFCRNIKEYNTKFKTRKLNPNDGHRYLPYIVLVIDEFADLIMTAGKEVETPIARLAQLARAIGIHLIIATQRPSVNVITGIIKANFPARIAFRVTSKIDSRTILDNSGADQLIGRGDMLYTQGNELTRIQCAFVDTPEVADITEYIGSQKAYPEAHLLPEYIGEEGGTTLDISADERDKLFREAAEVLVIAQQGSASLLQRKLKLGYNRAGRLIDQLEAAGIVGPFEGSKARQVLVPTIEALNQLLNEENETL